jgi:hypothetical protein
LTADLRPAPRFLHNLALSDILGSNLGRVVVGAGEDQLIAQIQHKHVSVALVESAKKGGVGLCCEDKSGLRFSDDTGGAMVGEGGFSARDDLLSGFSAPPSKSNEGTF